MAKKRRKREKVIKIYTFPEEKELIEKAAYCSDVSATAVARELLLKWAKKKLAEQNSGEI